MSDSIQCNAPGHRVKINISVVDKDGGEVTSVVYVSPESSLGFAITAMNADIALLSAAWGKAIADNCKDEDTSIPASVASAAC